MRSLWPQPRWRLFRRIDVQPRERGLQSGFYHLAAMLFERGFLLIDSQVHTDYVAAWGASISLAESI